MKKLKGVFKASALIALVSVLAFGCDKPTREMERAKEAIEEAKKAGAVEYAPVELQNAEQALADGKQAMDGLSYQEARQDFETAYKLAVQARDKALGAYRAPGVYSTGAEVSAEFVPPTEHVVYSGECLWRISEYKDIYDDPFQWPIIYDANRKEIDSTANSRGFHTHEENWIFPGQRFDIPRDVTTDDIKKARKRSGAPKPYLPPGY